MKWATWQTDRQTDRLTRSEDSIMHTIQKQTMTYRITHIRNIGNSWANDLQFMPQSRSVYDNITVYILAYQTINFVPCYRASCYVDVNLLKWRTITLRILMPVTSTSTCKLLFLSVPIWPILCWWDVKPYPINQSFIFVIQTVRKYHKIQFQACCAMFLV